MRLECEARKTAEQVTPGRFLNERQLASKQQSERARACRDLVYSTYQFNQIEDAPIDRVD